MNTIRSETFILELPLLFQLLNFLVVREMLTIKELSNIYNYTRQAYSHILRVVIRLVCLSFGSIVVHLLVMQEEL